MEVHGGCAGDGGLERKRVARAGTMMRILCENLRERPGNPHGEVQVLAVRVVVHERRLPEVPAPAGRAAVTATDPGTTPTRAKRVIGVRAVDSRGDLRKASTNMLPCTTTHTSPSGSPATGSSPASTWKASKPGGGWRSTGSTPTVASRLVLLARTTVGEGGWVDLMEPIIVRAGDAFIAVPEEAAGGGT